MFKVNFVKDILSYLIEHLIFLPEVKVTYPIFTDYYCKCVKYWISLTRMNNTRYPYHCYKMLRNLDNSGRTTWATKVKTILFKYGFGYVWVNENVGDEALFLKSFKQHLLYRW